MCFEGDHALFMQKPVTIFSHILQHIQEEDNCEIASGNDRKFLCDGSNSEHMSDSSNNSNMAVYVDGEMSVTVGDDSVTITTTTTVTAEEATA